MAYSEQFIAKLIEEQVSVQRGLEALVLKTIETGQAQEEETVRDYMLHGVGRRLNLLRRCLKTIFERFPPETTRPLGTDSLHEVQINLHAFVMNLYGLFENLAWTFVARHKLQGVIGGRTNVGLFLNSTQQYLPQPLKAYLTSPTMTAWHQSYLKHYRDALAHRIPLYIPPARYTDEQAARDRVLDAEERNCILAHRWDELERVRAERSALGFAFPVFLHSFVGGDRLKTVHLHPQLLCDIKTVLEFGPLYFSHWHELATLPDPMDNSTRPMRSIDDFQDEATLFSLSGEYFEAAQMLHDTPPVRMKVDMVTYFLLGHAAELLLKSFLYKRGDTIERLRFELGHDISRLLERAKEKGLPATAPTECMRSFSEMYKNKRTEYRSGGATLPLVDELFREVRALQVYVFDQVATFGGVRSELIKK